MYHCHPIMAVDLEGTLTIAIFSIFLKRCKFFCPFSWVHFRWDPKCVQTLESKRACANRVEWFYRLRLILMFVVIFQKKIYLHVGNTHVQGLAGPVCCMHLSWYRGDSLYLSHLFHDVETVFQIHFLLSQLMNELNRNRARGALWKRKARDNSEDSKGDFQWFFKALSSAGSAWIQSTDTEHLPPLG